MRVIGSLLLSLVIAVPALAQIGIRTASKSPAERAERGSENKNDADVVTLRRDDVDEDRVVEPDEEGTRNNDVSVSSPPDKPESTVDNKATSGGTTTSGGTKSTPLINVADCNLRKGRLPTMRPADGMTTDEATLCLFNQFGQTYLQYGSLVTSQKSAAATFELAADAFGPVRVIVSAAVATTTDEDDEEEEGESISTDADGDPEEPTADEDRALNLLRANGGNLAVTATLPLYFRPLGNGGVFLWNSYARASGNLQSFGSETSSSVDTGDMNGSLELAFSEFHLDAVGAEKALNILGYGKTSLVSGTKLFAQALGADARTFLHAQLGAGLRLADTFTLFFTYNWYSDDKIPGDGGAITFVVGK